MISLRTSQEQAAGWLTLLEVKILLDLNLLWGLMTVFTWLKPVSVLKNNDGKNQVVITRQFTTNSQFSPKEYTGKNTEE